jgi:hypothetical protein
MRALRQLCAVTVLTFTLTLSAIAGEIQTPVTSPTPQPAMSQDIHATSTDGDIHTPKDGEAASSDSLFEAALSLIESLLSLF